MNESTLSRFDSFRTVQDIEQMDVCHQGSVIMSLKQAIKFSGVPENEWRRLINEHKVTAEINREYGDVTLWYAEVKKIKYWWERYQEDKRMKK